MSSTSERPRTRLYLLHRWTGLLIAAVLVPVLFSGVVATFHSEVDAWTGRGERYEAVGEVEGFDLDAALEAAAAGVPEQYRHDVEIFQAHGQPLDFYFHEHGPDGIDTGVAAAIDPVTLEIVRRRTGDRTDVFEPAPLFTLSRFFLDLHIFLLLPRTLGLIVTGLAGLGLLALLASGLFFYPPKWSNFVRKPRPGNPRRLAGTVHALVGLWSLPFTLVMAVTGAFFSFAGAILLPVFAIVAFGGDLDAVLRVLTPSPTVSESTEVARLQPILEDALERSEGGDLQRLFLEHWQEAEANAVVTMVSHSPVGDTARTFVYDGHTGAFIGERSQFGVEPSFGGKLAELVGLLHFGTLFGMVTKILWGLFGLAAWGLAAAGLIVFVARQRVSHTVSDRLVRALAVGFAGALPLATALSIVTWASAVALGAPDVYGLIATSFVGTMLIGAVAGSYCSLRVSTALLLASGGALFVSVPAFNLWATGVGFLAVASNPATVSTLVVDLAMVGFGLVLIAAAWGLNRTTWVFGRPATPPPEGDTIGTLGDLGLDLDEAGA